MKLRILVQKSLIPHSSILFNVSASFHKSRLVSLQVPFSLKLSLSLPLSFIIPHSLPLTHSLIEGGAFDFKEQNSK